MRVWMTATVVIAAGCDVVMGLQEHPFRDPQIGCADGTREGFLDLAASPRLAGCAGAWSVAGLRPIPAAACERRAGNDGENVLGAGCSATDLCADDWTVCASRLDVLARGSCLGSTTDPNTFFVTGQSGPGLTNMCNETGTDDVFGCGTMGLKPDTSCQPLDRASSNDCTALPIGGWKCSSPEEIKTITKSDPLVGGGVLCCRADG